MAPLLLALLLVVGLQWSGARADQLLTEPPGQLVDVGTHRLHLHCVGEGQPTVVFESGLGGTGLEWADLQAEVALVTRACVYDRAGYGWSEPGPMPRTAARAAHELWRLLAEAGIHQPVSLVAHSYGGFIAQIYAREHPEAVAVLVLVDSSHPHQLATFPVHAGTTCRAIDAGAPMHFQINPQLPAHYPERYRLTGIAHMLRPGAARTQMSELCHFAESARQAEAAGAFPELPLVVVSRSLAEFGSSLEAYRLEAAWSAFQADLGRLNPSAQRIVAPASGHYVHLDAPAVVRGATVTSALMARRAAQDPRFEAYVFHH